MWAFLTTLMLTNLAGAWCVFRLLRAVGRGSVYPLALYGVTALMIAPPLATYGLYLLWGLWPGASPPVVLAVIGGTGAALPVIGIWLDRRRRAKAGENEAPAQPLRSPGPRMSGRRLAVWGGLAVAVIVVGHGALLNLQKRPIYSHDMLEYAVMGERFFEARSVRPFFAGDEGETGFYIYARHAPSFPLLHTWSRLVGDAVGAERNDLYFRSVSVWYGALLLALMGWLLARIGAAWALVGVLGVATGLSFFLGVVAYHLDTYRIALLMLAWVWLAWAVRNAPAWLPVIGFGLCAGLAAFAHSLGMILGGCAWLMWLTTAPIPWRQRCVRGAAMGLVFMASGGAHYLLSMWKGRGWL